MGEYFWRGFEKLYEHIHMVPFECGYTRLGLKIFGWGMSVSVCDVRVSECMRWSGEAGDSPDTVWRIQKMKP